MAGTTKNPGGRPYGSDLLTPELIEKLERSIVDDHLPLYIAGELHEVYRRNIQQWMMNGEKIKNTIPEDKRTDAEALYVWFFIRIKRAQATWQQNQLREMKDKGNAHWQREMTLLERRDREHYSRTEGREISGPAGGAIPVSVAINVLDTSSDEE